MPKRKLWNCEGLEQGSEPKVKLTYLDLRVRGEATRLALLLGGIPFEDERLSYEEIMEQRKELPFSQVPVLRIGDDRGPYAQSNSLLRWAGREGQLYPEDSAMALRCDGVTDILEEMRTEMIKAGYKSVMNRHPHTATPMVPLTTEQREQVMAMNNDVVFPTRFKQLEEIIAASYGPYFCGDSITIADLSLYVLSSAVLTGITERLGVKATVLDGCPKLQALVARVGELPKVQEWNKFYYADGFR